jgi:hypothetical protein
MLVYRDSSAARPTQEWLEQLVWRAKSEGSDLSTTRELCVDFGQLEAAIVDRVCARSDACTPLTRALRRAGAQLAATFLAALERDRGRAADYCVRAQQALEVLRELELPSAVQAKVPEGFAYYGLYPEQYVRAAELAFQHCRPERAVVIGLRSIGTTLSSVVEAYLARRACRVTSYALRPHGEPFARTLTLEPALQAELQAKTDASFFIVDEGPGLSGSSLTCVALALRKLGVERSRIVFLPSYRCDSAHFVNATARQIWREHAHFAGDFDVAWIAGVTHGAELRELSSGGWRRELGAETEDIACHPQHERRKFLALEQGGKRTMLRFAGLGSHGREVLARAQALEPSGVTPRVVGFADGMLALEFIPANISANTPSDPELTRAVARYLAFRDHRLNTGEPACVDALAEMTHHNISEALGPGATAPLSALALRASAKPGPTTIPDGRLLPHEWLTTTAGLRKVDGFDHGDDHFYPGPCDIAWDLAGAVVELGLDAAQRRELLARYVDAAADPTMAERLPFFELAYLAHRLGYSKMAAHALGGTAAGAQFGGLERRYQSALHSHLKELRP